MFLVAYRAFVEALANDDRVTLKKMTERNVYQRLIENADKMKRLDFGYSMVN